MQIDSMMWDIGLQDAAGYGQMCERIGYDCVWTYEAAHNPFMPLAQVAAATENIHIGTNIAVAFARSDDASEIAAPSDQSMPCSPTCCMTLTVDAGATPTPFSRNRSRYVAEKQSLFVSSLPEPSRGMSDACRALQDMLQASVAAVPKSLGDASGRGTRE